MDDRFTVKSITSSRSWDSLLRQLLKSGAPAVRSNLLPAQQMFKLLGRGGCKSVIIEDPYLDEDYRMCHARLHHLAQAALSKYCKRLHFFSDEVAVSDLRSISDDLRERYMGMSVWSNQLFSDWTYTYCSKRNYQTTYCQEMAAFFNMSSATTN